MATQRVKIVDAPGKFDLMVALFDGKAVEFTIADDTGQRKIQVGLNGVARKDGSGQSWLIDGYIEKMNQVSSPFSHFNGWYRSTTRQGWMDLADKYNGPIHR